MCAQDVHYCNSFAIFIKCAAAITVIIQEERATRNTWGTRSARNIANLAQTWAFLLRVALAGALYIERQNLVMDHANFPITFENNYAEISGGRCDKISVHDITCNEARRVISPRHSMFVRTAIEEAFPPILVLFV